MKSSFHALKVVAPSKQELDELVKAMRREEKEATEKFIIYFIPLGISIAARLASQFHQEPTNLISAANYGITLAANRIAQGFCTDHDNYSGYVILYIKQQIKLHFRQLSPASTAKNRYCKTSSVPLDANDEAVYGALR
jgi:DNA-directed RNA polymerase specialized sigma subunit